MSEQTAHLKLELPAGADYYNVGVTNANSQKIDAFAGAVGEQLPRICTTTYTPTTHRHTLTPSQGGLALPDVFAVRFVAAAGFAAGDTLYLDGVEYTPAYTDSAKAVEAGRWRAGAVVEVTLDKVGKRGYVGESFIIQLDQKASIKASVSPETTGFSTLLEYMVSMYSSSDKVRFHNVIGFSDLPETNKQYQATISVLGGILSVELKTVNIIWARETNSLTKWTSDWKTLATATPPQEFDLPLTTGFSNVAGNRSTYSKDQLGRGLVEFTVEGDIPANTITSIGVLPAGFRPSHEVHSVGYAHNVPSNKISIWINQNGPVVVYAPSAATRVTGQISFIAT